ncbi:hypothetical protein ACSBR1_038364 [Camellia fascicularis]
MANGHLRFGKVNKDISNTNVFEHSGKFYTIAENHLPQEIDILTLETLGHWDANGAWNRPFTSHPEVQCDHGFSSNCRHKPTNQWRPINKGYARIGVMPRYGNANSIKWFEVEPSIVFHIINCFEDGHEVLLWACRARGSIIPGPDLGLNKFEWFSRGFKPLNSAEENNDSSAQDSFLFSRCYEWRLNMKTGEVKGMNLTRTESSVDFL